MLAKHTGREIHKLTNTPQVCGALFMAAEHTQPYVTPLGKTNAVEKFLWQGLVHANEFDLKNPSLILQRRISHFPGLTAMQAGGTDAALDAGHALNDCSDATNGGPCQQIRLVALRHLQCALLLGAQKVHHHDDDANVCVSCVSVDTSVIAAAVRPSALVAATPDVFDENASAPSFSSKHRCTTDHGNREL